MIKYVCIEGVLLDYRRFWGTALTLKSGVPGWLSVLSSLWDSKVRSACKEAPFYLPSKVEKISTAPCHCGSTPSWFKFTSSWDSCIWSTIWGCCVGHKVGHCIEFREVNLQYETDDVAKEVSSTRTKVHFFKKVKLLAEEKRRKLHWKILLLSRRRQKRERSSRWQSSYSRKARAFVAPQQQLLYARCKGYLKSEKCWLQIEKDISNAVAGSKTGKYMYDELE